MCRYEKGTLVTWLDRIHVGDCRALMRRMIADGVRAQCIVTSPPYWGLRDYGVGGQLGLERTWIRHVARMRGVFRLAREILADDGVTWLNYGDSYYSPRVGGATGHNSTINGQGTQAAYKDAQRARRSAVQQSNMASSHAVAINRRHGQPRLKPKDLVGMPWRVALALQDDGWWLRSDVVWHKPNPMPESTRDRPTKSHEYVFLLAKGERYFYDADAIAEPASENTHSRGHGVNPKAAPVRGWMHGPGAHDTLKHTRESAGETKFAAPRSKQNASFSGAVNEIVPFRNVRTVWSIPSEPFSGAHFATFPRELVRRCILAGSRPGDVVFDPFMGSGTVAEVALSLGRRFVGTELNPEYARMFDTLRSKQQGLGV